MNCYADVADDRLFISYDNLSSELDIAVGTNHSGRVEVGACLVELMNVVTCGTEYNMKCKLIHISICDQVG